MFLLVLLTTCLYKESICGHSSARLGILSFSTTHFCSNLIILICILLYVSVILWINKENYYILMRNKMCKSSSLMDIGSSSYFSPRVNSPPFKWLITLSYSVVCNESSWWRNIFNLIPLFLSLSLSFLFQAKKMFSRFFSCALRDKNRSRGFIFFSYFFNHSFSFKFFIFFRGINTIHTLIKKLIHATPRASLLKKFIIKYWQWKYHFIIKWFFYCNKPMTYSTIYPLNKKNWKISKIVEYVMNFNIFMLLHL